MARHPPDEIRQLRDLRPERSRQRGHLTVQAGVWAGGDRLGRPVRCRVPSHAVRGLGARAAACPTPAAPYRLTVTVSTAPLASPGARSATPPLCPLAPRGEGVGGGDSPRVPTGELARREPPAGAAPRARRCAARR